MRRNRNTQNRNLLLSGIMGLCLTVFIFGLLFFQPWEDNSTPPVPPPTTTPTPTKTLSPTNCSFQKIKDVPNVPGLPIVPFAGSTTFAPLNKPEIIATIKKAHSQFPLQYVDPAKDGEPPGSGTGIKWLIKDKHSLSFAQSSRPLNDEEIQLANNRNVRLKPVPVAYDIIAIFVSHELIEQGLQGLTLAQVQDVFTGKIKNWKDVANPANWTNGLAPELPINPFKRDPNSGTVEFFKENVLKGDFGANVRPVGTGKQNEQSTTPAIRTVRDNRGGISFATASEVINQDTIRILPIAKEDTPTHFISPCADETCKAVDTNIIGKQSYPTELYRKLYVIIKQDGGQDEKAGEAYANMLKSCEGQKLVEQAGFVPL